MTIPEPLWRAYWQTYFAIIEEQADWKFTGKIIDDTEKQFYDPMISFSRKDILLANLTNRFKELQSKESQEVGDAHRKAIDELY